MSPTSYQLLHPALFGSANVRGFFRKATPRVFISRQRGFFAEYQLNYFVGADAAGSKKALPTTPGEFDGSVSPDE
jgi:hypothetical protein